MKPRMTLARITGLVLALAGAVEVFFFIYEARGALLLRRDKWDYVMGSVESYRLDHVVLSEGFRSSFRKLLAERLPTLKCYQMVI